MNRCGNHWIAIGAIVVCLSIALGAWAAHGLEKSIASLYENETRTVRGETIPAVAKYVGDFQTGADYQFGQGIGLILVGILLRQHPCKTFKVAALCLFLGMLLFSGSLYALVLLKVPVLGAVTPFGGVLMMVGWGLLAYGGWKLPDACGTETR
jgi:uncharacterized membrane protein YgdD (TMEM256/DUF423 family)